jgi:uncharacterized membrane protein YccC
MDGSVFVGLLSGTGAGGLVAAVAYFLFQRMIERMDRLEAEIAQVRDKRLAAVEKHVAADRSEVTDTRLGILESDVADHLSADQSQRILTELQNITGEMRRMSAKLDQYAATSEAQRADLSNCKNWLKDVAGNFERHRDNRTIHGGN